MNHSPISRQVRDLRCGYLLSVDACAAYVAQVFAQSYVAEKHDVQIADVRDAVAALTTCEERFDLSLCIDIVEHMVMQDAVNFLRDIARISDWVLIWIPLGDAPITQDTYGGTEHALHTHRSTWRAEDLTALGYTLEVYENAHTPMFGHRVDAAWAVKRCEG
jgi:hypothetical protein